MNKKSNNVPLLLALLFIIIFSLFVSNLQKNQNTSPDLTVTPLPTVKDDQNQVNKDWKEYSFKEVGITFSTPSDLNVSGEKLDESSFVLTAQRGQYPDKEYYQLYGMYNLAAKNVSLTDLKSDLDSASETSFGGLSAIQGQIKGNRNRFVTYIITNRGLITFATSQPTTENKLLTDSILKTLKFQ